MLFVNYSIRSDKEELLATLSDGNSVVEAERFDTSRGRPKMTLFPKKNDFIKLKCEMTERPTKDNSFIEGTYFIGRLSERDGVSRLRGVILSSPIYHLIFILMFAFFIYQCIAMGGFSPIPIILVVFDLYMFKDEFRKQGIIKRYIFRAFKMVYAKQNSEK